MRRLFLAAALLTSIGCTTVDVVTLSPKEPLALSSCTPTIYSDRQAAEAEGKVGKEVCMVTAYASTMGEGIRAAQSSICKCGVTQGFVKTTSDANPLIQPHVIVVGFER